LDLKFLYELAATQEELQIHTTPVAMRVWADRKPTIDGCREGFSPGPQMDCSRRGDRRPGIRLTGIQRAPYSTRSGAGKAEFGGYKSLERGDEMKGIGLQPA
jgi:hypothetical protein